MIHTRGSEVMDEQDCLNALLSLNHVQSKLCNNTADKTFQKHKDVE